MEYRIKPPSGLSLDTGELWRFRELFFFFTWRDIKVKYKQTTLGALWAVLQPLSLTIVFAFFLNKGLSLPTDGLPPVLFYFIGLMFWNLFASGLTGSSNSLVENAAIIKKIYFPRLIIPLSCVLVALFDFLIAGAALMALIIWYIFWSDALSFSWIRAIVLLPLSLALTLLVTTGIGCMFAALNIKYRDFRYLIPFAIQFLFFLTPVIYPLQLFSNPAFTYILALNPMTGAIVLARSAFSLEPIDWLVPVTGYLSALVLILSGLIIFRKMEAHFADIA
ncbi:MAG: ABC transporter permease [Saprospiraceae bacterium]|nr:ABC transporter permease [Saprospiraceae bacterium]